MRHGHVGDDKIDGRIVLELLQALYTGRRGDHAVAEVFKQQAGAGQHQAVVIHHQYAQPRNFRLCRLFDNGRHHGVCRGHWQPQLRGSALVFLALQNESPTQLLDEAMDHRQAQSCALAKPFGGEKRIHRRGQCRFIHPLAGVSDTQAHITSRLRERPILNRDGFDPGTDDDSAAIGHGIAGVGGQVQHRQFELIDVGHDRFGLR
ncbi:hypothetical protein D3C81_1630760 [compost metagenome]